jgi:hypothetical protein
MSVAPSALFITTPLIPASRPGLFTTRPFGPLLVVMQLAHSNEIGSRTSLGTHVAYMPNDRT